MQSTVCAHSGCSEPRKPSRRLCRRHVQALIHAGRSSLRSDEERFFQYANIPDDADACWFWNGTIRRDGYGSFWYQGRKVGAHRAAYLLFAGPVPEGLHLDHLCRNRACVNINHLEPVTNGENQRRSPIALAPTNAAKTHCPRGHEYTPENTLVQHRNGSDLRSCRLCKVRRIPCPVCGEYRSGTNMAGHISRVHRELT